MATSTALLKWAEDMVLLLDVDTPTDGTGSGGSSGGNKASTGKSAGGVQGQPDKTADGPPADSGTKETPPQADSAATDSEVRPAKPLATGSLLKKDLTTLEDELKEWRMMSTWAEDDLVKARRVAQAVDRLVAESTSGQKQSRAALEHARAMATQLPAVPAVKFAEGKDARAKYASAIQVAGSVRGTVQEAELTVDQMRGQQWSARDAAHTSAGVSRQAEQQLDASKWFISDRLLPKEAKQSKQVTVAALKSAKQLAKKAVQKDRALKKAASADLDRITATARKIDKIVSAASTKNKELAKLIKNIELAHQSMNEADQEMAANHELIIQLVQECEAKLPEYHAVLEQADQQEATYKSELTANDAEQVLRARYVQLGGDHQLKQALADEDKAFRASLLAKRAELTDWYRDRRRELGEFKTLLQDRIFVDEADFKGVDAWMKTEQAELAAVQKESSQLGDKLHSEAGKQLQEELLSIENEIAQWGETWQAVQKELAHNKDQLEHVNDWLQNVERKYTGAETYFRERETEGDNALELRSMTLQQKVDYLESNPKHIRARLEIKLQQKLEWTVKASVTDTKYQTIEFREPFDVGGFDSHDWNGLREQVQELKQTPLAVLQEDDPDTAKLREQYDTAGGDEALFQKLVEAWKSAIAHEEKHRKERAREYQASLTRAQEQVTRAREEWASNEEQVAKLRNERAEVAHEYEQLKEVQQANSGLPAASREYAALKVAERKLARFEIDIFNLEEFISKECKEEILNAEIQLSNEREAYEHWAQNDGSLPEEPKTSDLAKMPLRRKYAELTTVHVK